eukprot:CAMPEP_0184495068 /NCGR_PEP_ID=MMETSP0113_2-20130426/30285_1 /TAXON_ID=91329 /ORGANISM="Norrisiella sphaerica, Strain BC52" /LENGTH=531 /DNA_ID=CAMNT_0026881097 /DNA_START=65 /DNA_END=1660 /DNA_ORIENTATION=-
MSDPAKSESRGPGDNESGIIAIDDIQDSSVQNFGGDYYLGDEEIIELDDAPDSKVANESTISTTQSAKLSYTQPDPASFHRKGDESCLLVGGQAIQDDVHRSVSPISVVKTLRRASLEEIKLKRCQSELNSLKMVYTESEIEEKKELGQGHYAITSLVEMKGSDLKLVLKKPKPAGKDTFTRELKVLLEVGKDKPHRNVLKFVGNVHYQKADCYLTEYCELGSLDALHNKYDFRKPKYLNHVVRGTLMGLMHLHACGFIHRDIACRNLLIRGSIRDHCWSPVICDFGLVSKFRGDIYICTSTHLALPWPWMAPESLKHHRFSPKSDMWSCGVMIWEILTQGKEPYRDLDQFNSSKEKQDNVISGKWRLTAPKGTNKEAIALLEACLQRDIQERASTLEVLEKLPGLKEELKGLENSGPPDIKEELKRLRDEQEIKWKRIRKETSERNASGVTSSLSRGDPKRESKRTTQREEASKSEDNVGIFSMIQKTFGVVTNIAESLSNRMRIVPPSLLEEHVTPGTPDDADDAPRMI